MRRGRKPKPKPIVSKIVEASTTSSWRCLPRDGGASLPIIQRYSDRRFQALARDRLPDATVEDQLEAVAFLRLVPIQYARHAFMWTRRSLNKVRALEREWAQSKTVEDFHLQNLRVLSVDNVVGLVQALREGGWEKNSRVPVPDFVKLGFLAARDMGMTVQQIADRFGFGYWTVAYAFRSKVKPKTIGLVL